MTAILACLNTGYEPAECSCSNSTVAAVAAVAVAAVAVAAVTVAAVVVAGDQRDGTKRNKRGNRGRDQTSIRDA